MQQQQQHGVVCRRQGNAHAIYQAAAAAATSHEWGGKGEQWKNIARQAPHTIVNQHSQVRAGYFLGAEYRPSSESSVRLGKQGCHRPDKPPWGARYGMRGMSLWGRTPLRLGREGTLTTVVQTSQRNPEHRQTRVGVGGGRGEGVHRAASLPHSTCRGRNRNPPLLPPPSPHFPSRPRALASHPPCLPGHD